MKDKLYQLDHSSLVDLCSVSVLGSVDMKSKDKDAETCREKSKKCTPVLSTNNSLNKTNKWLDSTRTSPKCETVCLPTGCKAHITLMPSLPPSPHNTLVDHHSEKLLSLVDITEEV